MRTGIYISEPGCIQVVVVVVLSRGRTSLAVLLDAPPLYMEAWPPGLPGRQGLGRAPLLSGAGAAPSAGWVPLSLAYGTIQFMEQYLAKGEPLRLPTAAGQT